jgi:hypothetical protein
VLHGIEQPVTTVHVVEDRRSAVARGLVGLEAVLFESAVLAHVAVGAALMGWIVVQMVIIGLTSWLQPLMFAWGTVILALALVYRPVSS